MNIRRVNFLYHSTYFLGLSFFRFIYQLKVEGRENLPAEGPCLILPKHQFWTDIPIVALAAGMGRPLNYIAKQELFRYPGIGHFLTFLGGVPIDRLKPVKSLDSFRYVDNLLKRKEFIVLFPEGTYYPHSMGRGKHRFIQRLLKFQETMGWRDKQSIPFVPMGVRYGEEKLRAEIEVKIGKPLYANSETDGIEFTRGIIEEIGKLSGINKEMKN
jgi:1-acyl-sn-glycerol-3-phosphate acyltransferase